MPAARMMAEIPELDFKLIVKPYLEHAIRAGFRVSLR